jgi:hypothetical protein
MGEFRRKQGPALARSRVEQDGGTGGPGAGGDLVTRPCPFSEAQKIHHRVPGQAVDRRVARSDAREAIIINENIFSRSRRSRRQQDMPAGAAGWH